MRSPRFRAAWALNLSNSGKVEYGAWGESPAQQRSAFNESILPNAS